MTAQAPIQLSVTLSQLHALRSMAGVFQLDKLLTSKRQNLGNKSGLAIGRGLDFRELRLYQAGDDLRHLDWKVTASRGQPYTRVFYEEQQRPVVLFVDLASQLQFGQAGSKAVLAAKLTALLGWSALEDKDLIGAWIETDQQSYWQPPLQEERKFAPLLARLATITQSFSQLQPRAVGRLDKALEAFSQRLFKAQGLLKSSLVVLISDWVGLTDTSLIKRLAARGPLLLVHLTDPLDQYLPTNAGSVVLQGKVQPVTKALQAAWQEAYLQRVAALKAALGQSASYLQLDTQEPMAWL